MEVKVPRIETDDRDYLLEGFMRPKRRRDKGTFHTKEKQDCRFLAEIVNKGKVRK